MFSTFSAIGFDEFSDKVLNKFRDNNFLNYFYEETTRVIDLFYIYEEIDFENKKAKRLIGFVDEFNVAKKLVKALNKKTNSNKYDFDKIELMDKDEISEIIINQFKEV